MTYRNNQFYAVRQPALAGSSPQRNRTRAARHDCSCGCGFGCDLASAAAEQVLGDGAKLAGRGLPVRGVLEGWSKTGDREKGFRAMGDGCSEEGGGGGLRTPLLPRLTLSLAGGRHGADGGGSARPLGVACGRIGQGCSSRFRWTSRCTTWREYGATRAAPPAHRQRRRMRRAAQPALPSRPATQAGERSTVTHNGDTSAAHQQRTGLEQGLGKQTMFQAAACCHSALLRLGRERDGCVSIGTFKFP